MNVVYSNGNYQIYREGIKTYNELPMGTYSVEFSKLTGFYLTMRDDLVITEDKIYGSIPNKVDKTLRGFEASDRNFGVILSGKKGIGKSLFAKVLAIKAKDFSLPVIIVDKYIPGIANFLASIKQEVVVLFDEFEKTFSDDEDFNPQEEMLSLFDGTDSGKKLFIITCNSTNKLNDFLLNRPGRFHYHFILCSPNSEEIYEYMKDKLDDNLHHLIKNIINFSTHTDLTYDMLRAIAFELNMGYSISETLSDLNISKEYDVEYKITATFSNGKIYTIDACVDTSSQERRYIYFGKNENNSYSSQGVIRLDFTPSDIVFDINNSEIYVDPDKVCKYIDPDWYDLDKPNDEAEYKELCNLKLIKLAFTRKTSNEFIHKFLV